MLAPFPFDLLSLYCQCVILTVVPFLLFFPFSYLMQAADGVYPHIIEFLNRHDRT